MKFNADHPGVDLRQWAICGGSLLALTLRSDMCGVGRSLVKQTAFFRAFILSCFRDPLVDFAFCELKMKTNHENTKVRNHEMRGKNLRIDRLGSRR